MLAREVEALIRAYLSNTFTFNAEEIATLGFLCNSPVIEYEIFAILSSSTTEIISKECLALDVATYRILQYSGVEKVISSTSSTIITDAYKPLYFLDVVNNIRLNTKLTETEATGIRMVPKEKMIENGGQLAITFTSSTDYTLYGEKFSIYTANFLSNAIVKEILEEVDGKTKIRYGDTDSHPMYISYTRFKSDEDAKAELDSMMENKEKYINAQTLYEYLQVQ